MFDLLRKHALLWLLVISACFLFSCEKDVYIPSNLLGTWSGTCYDDIGTTYLVVSFDSDSMGELEFETSRGTYAFAKFSYSVSGNEVACKGVYASTIGGGSTNENYNITFRLEGEMLIPMRQYTSFILTQDGSIETNINGDIVTDKSELLQRTWVSESGLFVLHFQDKDSCIQYELTEPQSSKFSWAISFSYYYNYKFNELDLYSLQGQQIFLNITQLDENMLVLTDQESNKKSVYTLGSKSDIPTEYVRPF